MSVIRVSPSSIVVDRGEQIHLSAVAFGSHGKRLTDVDLVWTIVDPHVGSITQSGAFRAAGSPGFFKDAVSVTGIQNTPGGIKHLSARASVTVVGEAITPRLTSVAMLPEYPAVLARQIFRMRAFGYDQDGLLIPGVNLLWKVNNPLLGRINVIGYLTVEGDPGMFPQAVTVTGIWDGVTVSQSTDITVLKTPVADDFLNVQILPQRFHVESGHRLQLRAVALNGLGELGHLPSRRYRWHRDVRRR